MYAIVLPAKLFAKSLAFSRYLKTGLWLCVATVLLSCSSEEPIATSASGAEEQQHQAAIHLRTVSTKPWLITGGDVLVEITLDAAYNAAQLQVSLNHVDVSDRFRQTSAQTLQALLSAIPE